MAQEGDLAALKEALKHANGAAVGTVLDAHPTLLEEGGGVRLLGWAVERKRLSVVRALARRGINLDAATGDGLSLLQWAAKYGYESMTRVLLEQGAQAANKGERGITPLIYASIEGYVGVVRLLLKSMKGQGLEEEDAHNRTAMTHAASNGHRKVVELLLESGAIPHLCDVDDMKPLMHAAVGGVGVVQALLPYLKPHQVNARDRNGLTALHHACVHHAWPRGRVAADIVKALLLGGADRTITERRGWTPRALAEWCIDPRMRDELEETFQWWERESNRRYILSRATCLHKAFTMQRDHPTSQVPTYLEARVAAGRALPVVEVVSLSSEGSGSGKRKKVSKVQREQEQLHAVAQYVVKDLNEQLLTELLECFHGHQAWEEAKADTTSDWEDEDEDEGEEESEEDEEDSEEEDDDEEGADANSD